MTEDPNKLFSTTISSKRPPVVEATSESTCGIKGPMALPVTTPMRFPARSGSRSAAAAILLCRNRTAPTPFSRCSKSPYHSAAGRAARHSDAVGSRTSPRLENSVSATGTTDTDTTAAPRPYRSPSVRSSTGPSFTPGTSTTWA